MALPSLNRPIYEFKLPISEKIIKIQPYLVKHHKMLLMAVEGGNKRQILIHTVEVIKDCIVGAPEGFNLLEIPYTDFEYLYIKLRGVSIDNTTDVLINCKHCNHSNKVTVPLDDIAVENNLLESDIKVGPDKNIKVSLKHPNLEKVLNLSRISDLENVPEDKKVEVQERERLYSAMMHVKNVQDLSDPDTKFDFTDEEIMEWGSNLTLKDWDNIVSFSNSPPKVYYSNSIKCNACGKKTKYEIKGFNNFFG